MRWLRSLLNSPFECSGGVMWWCLWISIVLLGLSLQLPNRHIRSSASTNMTFRPASIQYRKRTSTVYSGIGSSYGYQWSTVLPRPRHRSTAMCFFASNIAQRLVIRRQLIDSYFFSSMLFGEELGRPQWGCCAVDMNAPAVMVIFVRSFNCGVFYSVPFSGQLMYHVRN